MKAIILKPIGFIFMVAAFLQWITFDYPNVSPWWPGAAFAPGMGAQVVNWGIVGVLGGVGVCCFKLGSSKRDGASEDTNTD